MYHTKVLLSFRRSAAPPNPRNHGYYILNGLCLPILSTMQALPDELDRDVKSHIVTDGNTDDTDSEESIVSSDDGIDDGLDI